jgi:hypothetical protein
MSKEQQTWHWNHLCGVPVWGRRFRSIRGRSCCVGYSYRPATASHDRRWAAARQTCSPAVELAQIVHGDLIRAQPAPWVSQGKHAAARMSRAWRYQTDASLMRPGFSEVWVAYRSRLTVAGRHRHLSGWNNSVVI